jgi:hypothetical protein
MFQKNQVTLILDTLWGVFVLYISKFNTSTSIIFSYSPCSGTRKEILERHLPIYFQIIMQALILFPQVLALPEQPKEPYPISLLTRPFKHINQELKPCN